MQDADQITRTAHLMADAARRAILPWFRHADLAADNKRPADFERFAGERISLKLREPVEARAEQ